MNEITRTKRMDVAYHYLLGCTYAEIETETGVSHGTIANIIAELENGDLTIPGTASDRINDLRQLSANLKKINLQPSQLLLGLQLFKKFHSLGITPERLDSWSEITKKFAQPDFTTEEFLAAALRLHKLEKSQNKTFENLADEYTRTKTSNDKLKKDIDYLSKKKTELFMTNEMLSSEQQPLKHSRASLVSDNEIQTAKLGELKLRIKEVQEEKNWLARETMDLRRQKTKLSSEVDAKEESLGKLIQLGLSNEDLLQLISFIERTGKNEGLRSDQVRKRFFSALVSFEDISILEKRREEESQEIGKLETKRAILTGEITELEKNKGMLQCEINTCVHSTLQTIKDIGEGASSQLQKQVADIENQLKVLMTDALKTGELIGEMKQAVIKGKVSEQSLSDFQKEVKNKLRVS